MSFNSACKTISLALLLFILPQAQAIIIRHDQADSDYIVYERDFPQIFYLHTRYDNKLCVATLISEQWAITAGHCSEETPLGESMAQGRPYPVSIAGQDYAVTELVLHPAFRDPRQLEAVDLALIKLDRPASGITPLLLSQSMDEQGQVLSLMGWGYSGNGISGRASNDGKLRRAQNTVMNAGKWLEFVFDDPRRENSRTLPLEGIPGLGDSGGPAYRETPRGLELVGVALGEIKNPHEIEQGRYGAISLYERISVQYEWIMRVISPAS